MTDIDTTLVRTACQRGDAGAVRRPAAASAEASGLPAINFRKKVAGG